MESKREAFIRKAQVKFGDRYIYDNVSYTGYENEVEIVCKIHGSFLQKPSVHLSSKIGCKKCAITHSQALRRLDITGRKFGLLTALKPLDGKPNSTPWFCRCDCGVEKSVELNELRKGSTKSCGCYGKSKGKRLISKFASQAINKIEEHGSAKFIRWLSNTGKYEGKHTNTLFKCLNCDKEYDQLYITHFKKSGQYCRFCKDSSGGFDLNSTGYLYLIKIITKDDFEFLKIGVTNRTPSDRIHQLIYKTNCTAVVLYTEKMSGLNAYAIEQSVLTTFKDFKINTGILISGNTETLSLYCQEDLLRFLNIKNLGSKVITQRNYDYFYDNTKVSPKRKRKLGKDQRGSKNHKAVFSDNEVISIRRMYKNSNMSHQEIADIVGKSREATGRAISGYTYNYLNEIEMPITRKERNDRQK